MNRSVVNRLLLYANQVKANGYVYFKKEYVMLSLLYLYGSEEKANLVLESILKGSRGANHFLTLNNYYVETLSNGTEVIKCLWFNVKPIKNPYALSTENSKELKELYAFRNTSSSYTELLFQLCFMGIISLKDYLRHVCDVDDYIGRFSVIDFDTSRNFLPSTIEVYSELYKFILQCYVENMSEGCDYGMSVYDFIYNYTKDTLRVAKHLWRRNEYTFFIRNIKSWKISDFSIFKLPDKNFIKKYCVEIGLCLPKIIGWMVSYYGFKYAEDLIKYILASSDEFLRESLLMDISIFAEVNSEGVDCMITPIET